MLCMSSKKRTNKCHFSEVIATLTCLKTCIVPSGFSELLYNFEMQIMIRDVFWGRELAIL